MPETQAWRPIGSFSAPSSRDVDGLLATLIAKLPKNVENDFECSVPDRLMHVPAFVERLHQGDIFGPGDDDLVYVGENPCAEGDIALVWRHVHDPSRLASFAINATLLRIDEPSGARFSEVQRGCCAEPTDDYYIVDLSGAHQRAVGVFKSLDIPAGSRPARRAIDIGPDKRPIYVSPADAAPPEMAHGDPDGGVERFEVSGRGEVLMTYRDSDGESWSLVEIGARSASNAGWISTRLLRRSSQAKRR